jgi:hypothetical protein
MTIFAAGLVKSSCSPYRVASARNLAVVSNDALRRGDGLWPMSVLLNARYAPAWVCCQLCPFKMTSKQRKEKRGSESEEAGRRKRRRRTHHVISNNSPMPIIDLNPINPKDSSHLINNGRSTSFNTIRLEDSVDVGSIQLVQVDKFIG